MSKAPFPATTIIFEAMLTAGNEWQVMATFPTGQTKHIGGFKGEAEADLPPKRWTGLSCF
jgi:hypothetical protein